ncbi:hypothetical protein NC651_035193 [Populus alba x Populus x berolinensis]|nr:hypothetical protein NC651_035193 [Populus alba x Populus x berolinensis]
MNTSTPPERFELSPGNPLDHAAKATRIEGGSFQRVNGVHRGVTQEFHCTYFIWELKTRTEDYNVMHSADIIRISGSFLSLLRSQAKPCALRSPQLSSLRLSITAVQ